MADDPWADFRIKSPAPSSKDEWAEFRTPAEQGITATDMVQAAADIPVIGPLARKGNAALNAALAPAIDPLLPDTTEKLPEKTFGERYTHALKLLEQPLEQFRQQHPVAATGANIAGTLAATIPLGGSPLLGGGATSLAGQVGRGLASGGVISGADAALRGEDPLTGGATGAALGAAVPVALRGASRVITPLRPSAERMALVDRLRNEGVDVTAGQATGYKPLQWAESALGDVPGAGGRAAAAMERQAEQFTGAALRRAGEVADRASPPVINRAFDRIGNQFETVAGRNVMHADIPLGQELTAVQAEYDNLVGPHMRAPVVQNTIDDIWHNVVQNNGHLTGAQYNARTSDLARMARGARENPQLQEALHGIRNALDDAFERSLTRSGNLTDLARLQQARQQYRNLLVIEKAATGAGSATAEGLISPSQLRSATVGQNRRMYARGQGDFADLARAGEAILKPLPQSGTAPRAFVMGLMAHEPLSGIVAPALAGRALMSRPVQAYLGSQRAPHGAGPLSPLQARALMTVLAARPHQQSTPLYFPPGP